MIKNVKILIAILVIFSVIIILGLLNFIPEKKNVTNLPAQPVNPEDRPYQPPQEPTPLKIISPATSTPLPAKTL